MQETPHVTSASHLSWAGALLVGLFVLPMTTHPAGGQELRLDNPLLGARVAGGFGEVPFLGTVRMHNGIDLAAPRGTPVPAAPAGTVELATWQQGYGNLVVIDHGAGYNTYYAHLSTAGRTCGPVHRASS